MTTTQNPFSESGLSPPKAAIFLFAILLSVGCATTREAASADNHASAIDARDRATACWIQYRQARRDDASYKANGGADGYVDVAVLAQHRDRLQDLEHRCQTLGVLAANEVEAAMLADAQDEQDRVSQRGVSCVTSHFGATTFTRCK